MVDLQESLMEFAELNRRRLFGCPPLEVEELERWQELQRNLVQAFEHNPEHERRIHERLPTHLHVDLVSAEGEKTVPSLNLSEGGLFVATSSVMEVGAHLELSMSLGDGALALQGVVAWTRAETNSEGPVGMGIRFVDLSADDRAALGDLMRRLVDVG